MPPPLRRPGPRPRTPRGDHVGQRRFQAFVIAGALDPDRDTEPPRLPQLSPLTAFGEHDRRHVPTARTLLAQPTQRRTVRKLLIEDNECRRTRVVEHRAPRAALQPRRFPATVRRPEPASRRAPPRPGRSARSESASASPHSSTAPRRVGRGPTFVLAAQRTRRRRANGPSGRTARRRHGPTGAPDATPRRCAAHDTPRRVTTPRGPPRRPATRRPLGARGRRDTDPATLETPRRHGPTEAVPERAAARCKRAGARRARRPGVGAPGPGPSGDRAVHRRAAGW